MDPIPTRKEREAELARRGFVDAASRVFSRKGFHGATMDEIARLAGYSPGAIYRYFPSKDDVFRAVVAQVGEEFIAQATDEPPVQLPFVDRLRWFLVRHLETALAHRDFFVTFVARNPALEWDRTSAFGADACAFHDRITASVASLMQLGVDEGVLAPGDVREHARVLLALLRAIAGEWLMTLDAAPELRVRRKTTAPSDRRIRRTGSVAESLKYPDTTSLSSTPPARRLLGHLEHLFRGGPLGSVQK